MTLAHRLLVRPLLTAGSPVPTQERASRLVSAALAAFFVVALPFVHLHVGFIPGFYSTFAVLVIVPTFLTAVFLLSQAYLNRLPGPGILGFGYLFTSVVVMVQLLTFPEVLGPRGLFGSGTETAIWLWSFWHAGYPAFVLAYLFWTLRPTKRATLAGRILWVAPYVALVVMGLAVFAGLHADHWLPVLSSGGANDPLIDRGVGPLVFELNLGAFVILVLRRNAPPVDRWLTVAVLASLLDVSFALLVQSDDVAGWYLARINSVASGSAVLVALSLEFARLLGAERSMREQSDGERREATRLRFVSKAGAILSESFDLDRTLVRLAKHVALALGPTCTIAIFSGETVESASAVALDRDVAERLTTELRAGSVAGAIARLGVPEIAGAAHVEIGRPATATAAARPHRIVVPVRSRYERVGVVICERSPLEAPYTDAEVAMAEEIGSRTALATLNARLYRRERRVADTLQRAMLPATMPKLAGVAFDAVHQAGNADADVGGDWYDAFELPDGRAMFSIGDVAGRGLEAAIVMGKMRQAIRAFALVDPEPSSILSNCDRMLRIDGGTMVTAVVGIVDSATSTMRFANAGHPGPVVAEGRAEPRIVEEPRTVPLSLIGREPVATAELALVPGQLIVFYTDGLIEATRDIVVSEAKLKTVVGRLHAIGSERPVEDIRDEMIGTGGRDDIAILAISVPAARRNTLDVQLPATADAARLLRHAVKRIALDAGIAPDRVFSLEVAVGEAVANVLEHAYGAATGDIRVRAYTEPNHLSVEVIDFGRWRAERSEGRGHGLNLMRQLCSRCEIVRNDTSTSVRFTEPIHA